MTSICKGGRGVSRNYILTFGLILAALGYADASIASRSLAQDLIFGLILAALGHADVSIASRSLAQDFSSKTKAPLLLGRGWG